MRDLLKVREAVLVAIPDEGIREEVRISTEGIAASVPFTAPELMGQLRWMPFCLALGEIIGEPNNDWKREVQRIVRDE